MDTTIIDPRKKLLNDNWHLLTEDQRQIIYFKAMYAMALQGTQAGAKSLTPSAGLASSGDGARPRAKRKPYAGGA